MRLFRSAVSIVVSFLLLAVICSAQQTPTTSVPNLIRYGGTLKDAQGAVISSSTVGLTFSIYNQQEGGAAVWMETQNATTDAAGNYTVLLGSATAAGLPADLFSQEEQRWLGVQVQGQAEQPRVLLVSVPYALKAHEAETLGGRSVSDFVLAKGATASGNGSNSAPAANQSPATQPAIKIGAATQGPTNFSGTTTDQIIKVTQSGTGAGVNSSAPTNAIFGKATAPSGTVFGVQGSASGTGGIGLVGAATSPTGSTFGIKASASSTSGTGLRGVATATTGSTIGVSAQVNSPAGTAALFNNAGGGKILSGQNNGVEKFAVDASGNITSSGTISTIGLSGTTSSPTGVGLTGDATNTTGANTGVLGETASINGIGVSGTANAATGQNAGVLGQSNSNSGWGIYGEENSTTGQVVGVEGLVSSTGDGSIGVLGNAFGTSGQTSGVLGITYSTTDFSAGVAGNAVGTSGLLHGVNGRTSSTTTSSSGVHGVAAATTGQVYGVAGETASTGQYSAGVTGTADATTGQVFGVEGNTNSTTNGAAGISAYEGAATGQVFGVEGGTNSVTNGAAGISGYEGAVTGQVYGVNGGTNSTTAGAAAVNGYEGATTGQVYGVFGGTNSTQGTGVQGAANATSGNTAGVLGSTVSPNGFGVFGLSNSTNGGNGVLGQTESISGGTAGVFVAHGGAGLILSGLSGSGYTDEFSVDAHGNGFYAGNLNVTGTLTKGGGSFKIDDPLDPENKYLSHSFVESPDMMNLYNGSVRLDARGEAWVTMPEYFQALNRDFQYVLTSVGSSQPRLYIAREIKGNRFKIAGGRPNGKVSWMVTGIRQDAWANAHRIPVEEEKSEKERGTYLHPELYPPASDKNTDAMLHH